MREKPRIRKVKTNFSRPNIKKNEGEKEKENLININLQIFNVKTILQFYMLP